MVRPVLPVLMVPASSAAESFHRAYVPPAAATARITAAAVAPAAPPSRRVSLDTRTPRDARSWLRAMTLLRCAMRARARDGSTNKATAGCGTGSSAPRSKALRGGPDLRNGQRKPGQVHAYVLRDLVVD